MKAKEEKRLSWEVKQPRRNEIPRTWEHYFAK
jgi:hypothetical protein